MKRYPDYPIRPVLQIAMPRPPRIYAPGGTVHVVARCNNREFYFTASEDFEGKPLVQRQLLESPIPSLRRRWVAHRYLLTEYTHKREEMRDVP